MIVFPLFESLGITRIEEYLRFNTTLSTVNNLIAPAKDALHNSPASSLYEKGSGQNKG